jgi:hypothetical protein
MKQMSRMVIIRSALWGRLRSGARIINFQFSILHFQFAACRTVAALLHQLAHRLHLGFGFLPLLFLNTVDEQSTTCVETATVIEDFHTAQ